MLAWPRLINAILQNFPSPAADDFLRRQLLETGNTTLAIPSDVRSEQSPRSRADRMISGQWLYFVNIQTGSGYRPRLLGGRQGHGINQRTARCIHDDRGSRHRIEPGRINEMTSLGSQRQMQRENTSPAK